MKTQRCLFILIISFILVFILASCGGPKEVTDLAVTTEIAGETLDGLYTGTATKTIPEGEGAFTYSDENIEVTYSGTWEDGATTGTAELEYIGFVVDYGDESYTGTYSGEAVNGQPEGNGKFIADLEEGIFEYEGEWKNGVISGKGFLKDSAYTVHFPEEIVRVGAYEGETQDGVASGSGTYTATNDEGNTYTYTGEWKNGQWNGHGHQEFETDEAFIMDGTFTNGEFTPTPIEYFVARGTYKDEQYTISEDIQEFIKDNPALFLENNLDSYEGDVNSSFQYKAFSKNPAQYGPEVISVPGLHVDQIFENNYWGADHTFCILSDSSGNVYFVYLYGFSGSVYEGSKVTLKAVPLDFFTYPNVADTKIWAIACAGISLS